MNYAWRSKKAGKSIKGLPNLEAARTCQCISITSVHSTGYDSSAPEEGAAGSSIEYFVRCFS